MARVPVAEERVVFSGANFAQTRQTGGGASPLVNFLHDWAARRAGEIHEEARRRVAGMAIQQQRELGSEGIAETPEGVRGPFADEFQHQAQALFAVSFVRDLRIKTRELVDQFAEDPEGFAEAYNAFMVPQLEPLEETNPVLAEEVRQEMDAVGLEIMFELQDNLAASAEAAARFDALSAHREFTTGVLAELNASGNETQMARAIDQVEASLENLHEAGWLTDAEFFARHSDFRNQAAAETTFGAFRRAIDAGDFGGAQALIRRTDEGLLFESNQAGRTVAANLATRMREAMREVQQGSERAFEAATTTVRNLLDLVVRGEDINPRDPVVRQAIQTAAAHANTPNQFDTLERLQTDIVATTAVSDALHTADVGSLMQLRAELADPSAAARLPRGAQGRMLDRIDELLQGVQEAGITGDLMALRDLPFAASAEERLQAQRGLSRQLGVPEGFISPYSRAHASRFEDEFNEAVDARNMQQAFQIVERFLEPAGEGIVNRLGLATQFGSTEFGAVTALSSLLGPTNASALLERARQGENVPREDRSRMRIPNEIADAAKAGSFGDPDLRAGMQRLLEDAFVGMAFETGDRSRGAIFLTDAGREFRRLVEPLRSTRTLDNGMVLPEVVIGDRSQARQLNKTLRNASKIFNLTEGDQGLVRTLRPRPMPDGRYAWFSTLDPGRIIGDEDGRPIITGEPFTPTQSVSQFNEVVQRADKALNDMAEAQTFGRFTSRITPRAAEVTGSDANLLNSIRLARETTPFDQRGGRTPSLMLGEEALRSLSQDEFTRAWRAFSVRARPTGPAAERTVPSREVPSPRQSPESEAVASAVLLNKFEQRFKNREQALAAFWVGEDVIVAAGDRWREVIPAEAEQFIQRVLHNLERM